jgi:hypothetical protein
MGKPPSLAARHRLARGPIHSPANCPRCTRDVTQRGTPPAPALLWVNGGVVKTDETLNPNLEPLPPQTVNPTPCAGGRTNLRNAGLLVQHGTDHDARPPARGCPHAPSGRQHGKMRVC